jgi:hypothetical protein
MYYCIQGTWVWTDGTTLDYTNGFSSGGGTAENCMFMYADDVEWDDIECTAYDPILSYVCKL